MTHYVHNIDPTLLSLGPIEIRWYGLMYLIGFIVGYFIFVRRYNRQLFALDPDLSQALITYLMIGMMIGARLVYVFVYNPMYYLEHWTEILSIWKGGLSYHGAALGFIGACILFSKRYHVGFYHIMDTVVLGAASGVFFGRIGNFINGELYGRVTDVPWAVVFPMGGQLPRHPSQMYQSLGEGLTVFLLLILLEKWERRKGFAPQPALRQEPVSKKQKNKRPQVEWKRTGILCTSYLIFYGIARFIVEFFREPDAQLGFFANYFSMGQILCSIMILIGIYLLWRRTKYPIPERY